MARSIMDGDIADRAWVRSSADVRRRSRRRRLRSWAIVTVLRCVIGAVIASGLDAAWWLYIALVVAVFTLGGFMRATEEP